MKQAKRHSPVLVAVISGATVPALVLALAAAGLIARPSLDQPPTPVELLMHPKVAGLAGVATGLAVLAGLFGARCEGLGTRRALLIPVVVLPLLALVAILWSMYVQAFPPLDRSGGSTAFQLLGMLWSLALPPVAITAYLVGRSRARGAPGA